MVSQSAYDGIWDTADADLERSAIGDILSDKLTDFNFSLSRSGSRHLDEGSFGADASIDTREMHHRVAVRERHIGVDLGDNAVGAFYSRASHIAGDSEADIALLIGERAIKQDYIDGPIILTDEARHLTEETWGGGAITLIDPIAESIIDEERIDIEHILILRAAKRRLATADAKAGIDGYIPEFGATIGEGKFEFFGCGGRALEIDIIAILDDTNRLLSRDELNIMIRHK